MKLITKATARALAAAYAHSAETGESGKDVLVKFFTPWANATWFISEGWPEMDGKPLHADRIKDMIDPSAYDWHLYGFCDLGDAMNAELGYVMLSDLKGLKGPFGLKVERDMYSTLPTMAEVIADYDEKRSLAHYGGLVAAAEG